MIAGPLKVSLKNGIHSEFASGRTRVLIEAAEFADGSQRRHEDFAAIPSFAISVSAIPSSRTGSRVSASGLNGSTAIHFSGRPGALVGGAAGTAVLFGFGGLKNQ